MAAALLLGACSGAPPAVTTAGTAGGLQLSSASDATAASPVLAAVPEESRAAGAAGTLPGSAALPTRGSAGAGLSADAARLHEERKDGVVKVGKPYRVAGRLYTPRHDPDYDETGIASWYGPKFHGRRTANGEIYNMGRLSAAHPTLPMPSLVEVTNLDNGRKVLVRVNDRGPYKRGRIIDLSERAARLLGFIDRGTARVRVRMVGPASMDSGETAEHEFLRKQPWFRAMGGDEEAIAGRTAALEVDSGETLTGWASTPVEVTASTTSPGETADMPGASATGTTGAGLPMTPTSSAAGDARR